MNPWYTDYSEYLTRIFGNRKVQKISVNAFATCPNRDGTKGTGGCIYCNNRSFSPSYTQQQSSVAAQLAAGREFFGRKYPQMEYLAYFQSYTGTYGNREHLMAMYREALNSPGVCGMIIGTRPDCVDPALLDALAQLGAEKPVIIEYGAETSNDTTLKEINRNHTWLDTVRAVEATHSRGISCGLHIIIGLPSETEADFMKTIDDVCRLPIDTLKIHQMQIIRDTELHRRYVNGTDGCIPLTAEQYLGICAKIVEKVPRRIAIERFVSQAPADLLVAPRWGLKNYQFTQLLHNMLKNIHNSNLEGSTL